MGEGGGDRTLSLINAWLFYNLHAKTRPLETLVGGRPWNIEWLKVNRAFSQICDTDRLHIPLLFVELKKLFAVRFLCSAHDSLCCDTVLRNRMV
jgi:hypothetical protein